MRVIPGDAAGFLDVRLFPAAGRGRVLQAGFLSFVFPRGPMALPMERRTVSSRREAGETRREGMARSPERRTRRTCIIFVVRRRAVKGWDS